MQDRQAFFNSRALFWGLGLSLLLNITDTNFWIAEILGSILGLVILLLVKRTNNSKVIKAISGFVISLFVTCVLVNMGSTLYLRETPIPVLAIVPIIGGFIMSRSRKEPFKKTLFVLFVYSFFTFICGGIILMMRAKSENLLPMFYFDYKNILWGTLLFTVVSITPVLCLNDVKDKKNMIINYLTGMLTIIAISFLIVSVLGSKEALLYRYPEFAVLKRIKIFDFFSNVENIFIIMMVVDLLVTIASGFRNIQVKNTKLKFIAPALMIILVSIIGSSSAFMTVLYSYFPYVLSILLILTLIPKK